MIVTLWSKGRRQYIKYRNVKSLLSKSNDNVIVLWDFNDIKIGAFDKDKFELCYVEENPSL